MPEAHRFTDPTPWPSDAVVEATYRCEGSTDPDDEAVVFGLSCPSCGTRGVLVAAYGPSASAEEAAVVAALRYPD